MNYDHINAAIDLLQNVANRLQSMVQTTPSDRASNQTVYEAREIVQKALAEMSAAVNPPIPTDIPEKLLDKAEALGIPLDDIEIRVAISSHHPSQLAGVLAEIDNRAEDIRRRREYFLVRLPDMPIEKLGSRLPIVTAADFNWPQEVTPPEILDAIKAKYKIDKLLQNRNHSPSSLFEKIKQANEALAKAKSESAFSEPDEDIPF